MKTYLWKLLESWFLKLYWYLDAKQSEHVNQKQQVTDKIYQHIGEFVVLFQWLEFRLREIGFFILERENMTLTQQAKYLDVENQKLIEKVKKLFLENVRFCFLPEDFEKEFISKFCACCDRLHKIRKIRNNILHSAYLELDSHGTYMGMLKTNNKKLSEKGRGESLEYMTDIYFDMHFKEMATLMLSLSLCLGQLRMRYKCTKEYQEFLNANIRNEY